MIKNRNIAVCIILSIVTCGIYSLIWMASLNDDSLNATSETGTSGGMVVLLSIITCGIYTIYWLYVLGKRVDQIKGNPNGSSGILFLILSLLGFGFVGQIIAQDALNKVANS